MGVTDGQRELIEAIRAALPADREVEAAWLAGSLGQGGGDAFSDVDILVLGPAGGLVALAKRWADDLSPISETVLINVHGGGRVVSAVTPDWRRFDLTFVEPAEIVRYDSARLQPLFNKGDVGPPHRDPLAYRTRPQVLEPLVKEFFRLTGLLVVGVGREEYVLGLTGTDLIRRLTVDLMLEENGVGPAERGGALKRNPFLTAEQRAELAALSPVAADRAGIIAANIELAAIFLPRARRLAAEIGMAWPEGLEAATRAHLLRNLGVVLPE